MQFRIFPFLICLLLSAAGTVCFFATDVLAGDYLDSAHGSTTYGVARPDLVAVGVDFVKANCAHCHEQHASIGGAEPAPAGGAATGYLLFDDNNTDQATNFCFNCHRTVSPYQSVVNRSYSYRAGGWNTDPLDNIKDAFAQSSSHNLADIVTFAAGFSEYTLKSNACAVCHDPHLVQGDPANAPDSGKGGTRRVVITDITSSPVVLFTSKMDPGSTSNYLAPNCFAGNSEPVCGDGISNGTDLPDYVTFCSKCHIAANVYSTEQVQNLKVINWANEIHGQVGAWNTSMLSPYNSGATTYVLSCLDCHEPHGSGNMSLLRGEVNGGETTTIASGVDFEKICIKCHDRVGGNWDDAHHTTDPAYLQSGSCDSAGCHSSAAALPINCVNCHFHGAEVGVDPLDPATDTGTPLGNRKTF